MGLESNTRHTTIVVLCTTCLCSAREYSNILANITESAFQIRLIWHFKQFRIRNNAAKPPSTPLTTIASLDLIHYCLQSISPHKCGHQCEHQSPSPSTTMTTSPMFRVTIKKKLRGSQWQQLGKNIQRKPCMTVPHSVVDAVLFHPHTAKHQTFHLVRTTSPIAAMNDCVNKSAKAIHHVDVFEAQR